MNKVSKRERKARKDNIEIDNQSDKLLKKNKEILTPIYEKFKDKDPRKLELKDMPPLDEYQNLFTRLRLYGKYFMQTPKPKNISNVAFDFEQPYEKAAEYFSNIGVVDAPTFYDDLINHAGQSFTVSRITCRNTLSDIKDYLETGLKTGNVDPNKIGEAIQKFAVLNGDDPLTPHHIDTIIRTNLQSSYAEGKFLEQKNDPNPYWQYFAIDDDRTTDLCGDLNGKVFRKSDHFWDYYYPPNHFNCRSSVETLDDYTVIEEGLDVEQDGTQYINERKKNNPNISTGEGFNRRPGKSFENYLKKESKGIPITKLSKNVITEQNRARAVDVLHNPEWRKINAAIYSGNIPQKHKIRMRELSKTLEKLPTYSGTAYSSQSVESKIFKRYAEQNDKIKIPQFITAGTKRQNVSGEYVVNLQIKSSTGREFEGSVLFDANQTYKIIESKIKGNKIDLKLEQ